MAFHYRSSHLENQGVRGSVNYRKMSESYSNEGYYSKWIAVLVNAVLVLLAALIVLTVCRYFAVPEASRMAADEDREIYYTLEFYDISGAMAASPAVGTSMIDPATGAIMGEIVSLYAAPATTSAVIYREEWQSVPQNAVPSTVELPVQLVTVTVRTTAAYRDGLGYTKNGVRLAMGATYTVSFSGTLASGVCTALTKGES